MRMKTQAELAVTLTDWIHKSILQSIEINELKAENERLKVARAKDQTELIGLRQKMDTLLDKIIDNLFSFVFSDMQRPDRGQNCVSQNRHGFISSKR